MNHTLIDQIRKAVTTEEFQKALVLWDDFSKQLEQQIRAGSLSPAELEEAGELVAWARQVAVCARARALDQLNTIAIAERYESPRPPQSPRLVLAEF